MRRFEGPSWRLKKLENRTYQAVAELGLDPITGQRRTGARKFTGTRAQVKAAADPVIPQSFRRLSADFGPISPLRPPLARLPSAP